MEKVYHFGRSPFSQYYVAKNMWCTQLCFSINQLKLTPLCSQGQQQQCWETYYTSLFNNSS